MMYEENLYEGGNAVSGAEAINCGKAKEIANTIADDLKTEFESDARVKGSLPTKNDAEECGDIDIALQYEWKPEEIQRLKSFLMDKYGCEEPVVNNGLRVISFGYKYDSEDGHYRIVQVDICQTGNMDFHMAYHAPSVNSSFKNAVKDTLIRIVIKCTPIEGEEDELFGDEFGPEWNGKVKSSRFYSLTADDNVVKDRVSFLGKRGKPVSKPQVDLSAREHVTDSYDEITKMAFGPEVTSEDLSSTESIIAYLFSGKYPHASEKVLNSIKEKMIDHLSDRGSEEERATLPQQFLEIWNKYAGGDTNTLNESRFTNFSLKMTNLMRRMQTL